MDIQEYTNQVYAQRVIEKLDNNIQVDWAVKLISEGYESESLYILAGLTNDEKEVKDKYFIDATQELNIILEADFDNQLTIYINFIIQSFIDKTIDKRLCLEAFNNIYIEYDYDWRFYGFYELYDSLLSIEYKENPYHFPDLNEENLGFYILNECLLYLDIQSGKVDKNIRKKIYCNQCKCVRESKLKSSRFIIFPFKIDEIVCKICNSNKIDYFNSIIGRNKMFQPSRIINL